VKTRPPNTCPLFASRLQANLLAELFAEPEEWRDCDELRSACAVSASTLHDELGRLREAGIIERDESSRPYRYRPDMNSPLAEPVRHLVERTVGVEATLRRALAEVDGIEAAAIFGSWARGEAGPRSDIDVMVVGAPEPVALNRALASVERAVGREVNGVVFSPSEVRGQRSTPLMESVSFFPFSNVVGDLRAFVDAA